LQYRWLIALYALARKAASWLRTKRLGVQVLSGVLRKDPLSNQGVISDTKERQKMMKSITNWKTTCGYSENAIIKRRYHNVFMC